MQNQEAKAKNGNNLRLFDLLYNNGLLSELIRIALMRLF